MNACLTEKYGSGIRRILDLCKTQSLPNHGRDINVFPQKVTISNVLPEEITIFTI